MILGERAGQLCIAINLIVLFSFACSLDNAPAFASSSVFLRMPLPQTGRFICTPLFQFGVRPCPSLIADQSRKCISRQFRRETIGARTLLLSAAKHNVDSLDEFNEQLARGIKLESMKVVGNVSSTPKHDLLNHPVMQVLHNRAKSKSKPGERTDPYKVALSIEGGGMRGCISAGMTAALKDLGLEDCFDVVYGAKPTAESLRSKCIL
jgi:hypothetical protein